MLKQVLGILPGLQTLELRDLLLDGTEGLQLLDEVKMCFYNNLTHTITYFIILDLNIYFNRIHSCATFIPKIICIIDFETLFCTGLCCLQ